MARNTPRRRAALVALAAGATLACVPTALATFPGDNGAIAFERNGDIWTIDPDGTGEKRLTSGAHRDGAPEWSPDGRQLLFQRSTGQGTHIYRINADGSGLALVRQGSSPQFSGDGRRIAFQDVTEALVADRDGSGAKAFFSSDNLVAVTDWAPTHSMAFLVAHDGDSAFLARSPEGLEILYGALVHDDRHFSNDGPEWSPDGSKIAFATRPSGLSPICFGEPTCPDPDVGLRVMDLGGGGLRTVLHTVRATWPAWSPDGTRIVFDHAGALQIIRPDGTGKRTLTKGSQPDWQPLEPKPAQPKVVRVPGPERVVTVPVEVPGPERVVETVVARTAQGALVCKVPKAKQRFTLVLRAHRSIRAGMALKVRVDLNKGRRGKATVLKGKALRLKAGVR